MKIVIQTIAFTFLISMVCSCQTTNSKEKLILDKNKCYELKLVNLKKSKIYTDVMTSFRDTFNILKTKKEYFGAAPIFINQIDEAVFFKTDSSECMLVVLQKNTYDLVFGTARTVRGSLKNNKWYFQVSMEIYFEKNYFKLFKENTFENISKLARYSVLTEGGVKRKGCEIDDDWWFVHLKD